jgi:DNA-binding transcriptional regulator YdaS (Cro superfamily)
MKRKATRPFKDIDWLALAISRIGGEKGAARRFGVPQATVARWLEHGIADAPFAAVVLLSTLGDVLLEHLARRLGPYSQKVAA